MVKHTPLLGVGRPPWHRFPREPWPGPMSLELPRDSFKCVVRDVSFCFFYLSACGQPAPCARHGTLAGQSSGPERLRLASGWGWLGAVVCAWSRCCIVYLACLGVAAPLLALPLFGFVHIGNSATCLGLCQLAALCSWDWEVLTFFLVGGFGLV